MDKPTLQGETPLLPAGSDLETVLAAWHTATVRLEQTHQVLREEVRRLTDELEAKNRELARKNRLADLGQMASHIAHEVRNNLVPVTLYLGLLRRRLSGDAGGLQILDKIESGFVALDATVNDLLHFTADRDPQWEEFAARDLVDELCLALAPQLAAQSIDLDLDVPEELHLVADRHMLRRALLNLMLNAIDALPDGGQIAITVADGPWGLEIEVADTGPGLSLQARQRAFEPFYTTKPEGTGLGLAIVYRIAEAHGGAITALNCPDGGAAFTLQLPHRTLRPTALPRRMAA